MNDILGYYRFPALCDDRVVFCAEDDLWEVTTAGGAARRLTRGTSRSAYPALSPGGELLAYVSREEGTPEVMVMPGRGGPPRRLTYTGGNPRVVGWSPDGRRIRYVSSAGQPFAKRAALLEIDASGGEPRRIELGPVSGYHELADGRAVLGWHQDDPARWKRYRGGRAGVLWIGDGRGDFRPLVSLPGNLVRPMWVGDRVIFLSDHEGVGNLYSCAPDGSDLRRETEHGDYYARWPSTDGRRVIYTAGADLWLLEPGAGARRLEVTIPSAREQRARRFVRGSRWVESAHLHPEGHSVAATCRGRPVSLGLWEGPVLQAGEEGAVRYRLTHHLPGREALIAVADRPDAEEALEILPLDGGTPRRLDGLDIGRALEIAVSPAGDRVAVSNHRQELLLVSLEGEGERVQLDHSPHARMAGMSWSPDGRWLAWSCCEQPGTSSIKLAELPEGGGAPARIAAVTRPEFRDIQPCFDSLGRYLYFLSYRDFNPVFDHHFFGYGFPRGARLCLVTLRADLPDPFLPAPAPLEPPGKKRDKHDAVEVRVDLEGIEQRVVRFPVGAGSYGRIGSCGDRVFYTSLPVRGMKGRSWVHEDLSAYATLRVFDLKKLEDSSLISHISDFEVGPDHKTLLLRAGRRWRVIPASLKVDKEKARKPGRKSGWLDMGRIAVEIRPPLEWAQMLREAWRLMRDHFWTADMSGVDWPAVWERYAALLPRVGTRSEFSDLVWELYGELGTSHAYELGGDYQRPPDYRPGYLGAELEGVPGGARIASILTGDTWDPQAGSPLRRPGVDVRVGDVIVAVDGKALGPDRPLQALLLTRAGREVSLSLQRGGATHRVAVRALRSETPLRYRDWVRARREWVHRESGGRVGYVHVPDMGPSGFAEFHRAALVELDKPGLLIDVRFNGGGHVSGLLLQVLARPRLGYKVSRYGVPWSYPREAPHGPMVALTNEYAGSDGDIFTHGFKMLGLGPVVGTRTWGGVVGIWPRHRMVDGSVTSQPEFANWFSDVGYALEGVGATPDHEVVIRPQDYAAGEDPQLRTALRLVLEAVEAAPEVPPDFGPRPGRGLP